MPRSVYHVKHPAGVVGTEGDKERPTEEGKERPR